MNSRIPWLLGTLAAMMLATALPAAAKTIAMQPLSRGAVETACDRARGVVYGVRAGEDGENYGCRAQHGSVDCSPDGQCFGAVSDLMPMTTNSLDAILGVNESVGPIKLGPKDSRITPLEQSASQP